VFLTGFKCDGLENSRLFLAQCRAIDLYRSVTATVVLSFVSVNMLYFPDLRRFTGGLLFGSYVTIETALCMVII
jgi:hypothetical protein